MERLRNLAADGVKVPAVENEVKLPFELLSIWQGFADLSSARQNGFDTNPIAYADIAAYVELYQVGDPEMFVACVRACDGVFIKHMREKAESAAKQK